MSMTTASCRSHYIFRRSPVKQKVRPEDSHPLFFGLDDLVPIQWNLRIIGRIESKATTIQLFKPTPKVPRPNWRPDE